MFMFLTCFYEPNQVYSVLEICILLMITNHVELLLVVLKFWKVQTSPCARAFQIESKALRMGKVNVG